jgi:hypothetical protein
VDVDGGVPLSGLSTVGEDRSAIGLCDEWLLGVVKLREASI